MLRAAQIIEKLGLTPHPIEGGYFRETYRHGHSWPGGVLPGFSQPRSVATAIYFLLTPEGVSEMHRLPGDELFHFYSGDPFEMLQLWPGGRSVVRVLGGNLAAEEAPQILVPGGVWQGSRLLPGPYGYGLVGCTMAPGFDYGDYVRGGRAELLAGWPDQAERITRLTPHGSPTPQN